MVGKNRRSFTEKSYGEPRWEKRTGQVSAFERATLYGLVVYSQRRIQYGLYHPVEAREIFIREALVEGEFETRAPFFAHNQKLVREMKIWNTNRAASMCWSMLN
jgi:ATP-dependent helicase HrpA